MKTIFKTISTITLVATLVLSANNSSAQAFEEGTSSASIGYGFVNFGNTVLNAYESEAGFTASTLGPLFAKYEYAVSDKFGIGLNVSFLSGKAEWTSEDFNGTSTDIYNNSVKRTGYNIMMRFNWHFGDHDIIDPYFGLAAGYRSNNWEFTSTDPDFVSTETGNLIPFGIEATFGTRFLFTDNLGAYVELGLARAFFQVGLTGKF